MYRIGTFAKLAGVTVKALYYYERHGLLGPQRTDAGYRRYDHQDLLDVRRIVALKSLGLSLKQIAVVQKDAADLRIVCAQQRLALAQKRERLDRAVHALDRIASDEEPVTALNRFVHEWNWAQAEIKRQALAAQSMPPARVSASKLALFREIEAALDGQSDDETSGRLIDRWHAMVAHEVGGDVDTQAAMQKAWANWRNWPDGMRRYVASLFATEPATLERVAAFIARESDA